MPYLGNSPSQQAFTPTTDYFSGNGSTTAFTLSRPVASVHQVEAVIENVVQNPSDAYTVSGQTITFTSAPPSGTNNIYVRYTSPITQLIQPGQTTVGTTQLIDAAVTNAKVNDVAGSKLTGTQNIPKAALPTGSVLQVISATDSTERNTTSTSFGTASNTLSVTITPTASTSKFFIVCNTNVFKATAGSGFLTIYRNSTNLGGAGGMSQFQQAFYSSSCITYLDSPATSSAITYQLYFRSSDSNPAYIQATNGGGTVSSFTVFEIAS